MSKPRVSAVRLGVVLAFFLLVGAAMALFVWHTLSDFLAGLPVEGGPFLLAIALAGVFFGFAWLLARYLQVTFEFPEEEEDHGS